MKKKYITGTTVAVLCLLFHLPSLAGVYKWVDENGRVHYGDRPGKSDASTVPIRKNESTRLRHINKPENDSINKQDAGNTGKPASTGKPAISKAEQRRLCNEAKSDIAAINSRGRMREKNARGEYTYLTEKQRQQRLAAAKNKQHKYCR